MKLRLRSVFGIVLIILSLFPAESLPADKKPDWVDGPGGRYPEELYLVGVGFGDSRQGAENSAYAALARIFRAEVRSTTEEVENFKQREKTKGVEVDRRIDIQSRTEVSTDKKLEQVRIAERWVDPTSQVHYALAVLDRSEGAASLRQKAAAAEMEAKEWESRARQAAGKLEKVRSLRKAAAAAALGESYEADLRVIQPGSAAPGLGLVSSAALRHQLAELLSRHFQVAISISGPHAASVESAILAGLHEKGFTGGPDEEIVIDGRVDFEEAGPVDPKWHYVRWTARLTLKEKETEQVFGSINRSGREGQLSAREANQKALFALQTELNALVGEKLLEYLYGE